MLLFKDGRFYARYLSFVLPDGCYLNPNPPIANDYGVNVWEEDHQLEIDISEDNPPRSGELSQAMHAYLFEGPDRFEPDSSITEIEVNGLAGYEVFYHSNVDYYEIWFALPDNHICEFFVQCPRGPVENIKGLPVVQEFLKNLRKEERVTPSPTGYDK